MKLMLIGASGLLGSELLRLFPDAAAPDSRKLDITDEAAVYEAVSIEKPDILVNCAAMTDVDACEKNPTRAVVLNTLGPLFLARACDRNRVHFVNISTDFVFDGTQSEPIKEDAKTGPVNVYGKTKLDAESYADCTIRVAWLYGRARPSFPEYVLSAKNPKAPFDCVGSPTSAIDAAKMTAELMEQRGVFHAVNSGETSKYGFAREAVRVTKRQIAPVPVSQDDLKRPAKRPAYTALRPSAMKRRPRPWQEALESYLFDISGFCHNS